MYCSLFSHETGDLLRAAAGKGLISSEYVWIAMSVHASHSDKKAISQQQRLAAQGGGHLLRDRGGPPPLPNGLICVTYELTNNVPQQAIGEGATIWTEALIAYAYNALRPLLERGANASDLRTRLRHKLASTPLQSSGAEDEDQRANELDMSATATAIRRARRARSQCNPRGTSLPLLQHREVFSEFLLERFRARQESLRQGAAASGDSAAASEAAGASAASRLRVGISPAATSAVAPARSLPDTARTHEKGTEEAASGAQAMQPEAFNASLATSAPTATATAAALRSDIDGLLMRSRFNFYNRKNSRWNFVRLPMAGAVLHSTVLVVVTAH